MRKIYIWDKIVSFFAENKESEKSERAVNDSYVAKMKYLAQDKMNFTAIFSSKLANLAVSEANAEIKTEDKAEVLKEAFNDVWRRAKNITATSLGVGGVFLIPHFEDGRIYTEAITQDRVLVEKSVGGRIIEATVLAESIRKDGKNFIRWTHYALLNNELVISSIATSGGEVIPLSCVEEWKEILPEVRIKDCDRMLFAYLKSPADSRDTQGFYGVPVTYGCDSLIREIHEHLAAISKEYKIKQAFIGADSMLFSAEGKLPKDGIFKMLSPLGSERDFWQEFNPEIRHEPYFKRLEELYRMLESAVGTSRGILTEVSSKGATATEIKRARFDTFAFVEEIRRSWEYAANDLLYCYKKLLCYYLDSREIDASVLFDWSYSLFESSEESFAQLKTGFDAGVISAQELRQYLKPSENLKLAEENIKKIRENKEENYA